MGDKETFAERVSRLVKEAGLNQSDLAKKTGIERSQINRIINGKTNPRPEQIGWLAEVLGTTVQGLMADIDWPAEVIRAIDQSRAAIERVLRAEAERDEAVARSRELETQLARERKEREEEREQEQEARRRSETQWQARVAERDRRAAAERNVALAKHEELQRLLRQAGEVIGQLKSNDATLRVQLTNTQRQLADTRANTAAGHLFAGLAGAVIRRAID